MRQKQLIITVLMALLFPLGLWADDLVVGDIFTADGVTYKVTSTEPKEVQVGNEGRAVDISTTGVIDIPSVVKGTDGNDYSVTSIGGYAFFEFYEKLTSVTIPNSVTSIGYKAFCDCSGLTSMLIPNSVTSIGDYAFCGCSLTSVIIPSSVTSIGNKAFSFCEGLTSLTISEGVTTIGWWAFAGCSMTSVTIPSSVVTIGDMAFSCDNLTSITVDIQEPLVISDDVFSNRANATLYVPKGSKSLYELAEGWKDFKTIEEYQTTNPNAPIVFADDNVKALCVANWDADGDGELSEAEAAAVTDLGTVFKGQSEITSFNELEYFTGLTTIAGGTFAGCSGMTSVMIPSTVTSIGDGKFPDDKTGAFSNCSSLTSLTIPEGVTSIGTMAFSGCHGLTMMTIPKSVGYIGNGVFGTFNKCSNLIGLNILDLSKWCSVILAHGGSPLYGLHLYVNGEEVHDLIIPDDVTYIAGSVFGGCKGLSSVTIPSSVTEFGRAVFYDNNELTSVIVERAEPLHLDLTEDFFSDRVKATLFVPEGSVEAYAAADYWKDFKKIKVIGEPGDHKVGDTFTVDGVLYQVTSVDPLEVQVGNGNSNFGSVAIDKSIEGAFEIPATVTGDDENVYSVTAISKGAFSGCSGMTSVTIPNSVTAIAGGFDWGGSVFGGGAFENCGLITLTIPSSVTSIGEGAFTGCYDLTSIVVEEGNTVYDSRNNCNAIIEKEMNFMVGDEIVDTRKNHLIAGCKNTIIPDDVISIGTGAFLGCKFLTSIDIPNSVTYISDYAFWYCIGLTSLNISENVTSIGTQAFAYCTDLTSITIPESVKTIWHDAFYGCRGLVSASILPKSLSKYGLGLHSYSGRYVGIFGGCENLTTVIVGAEEPFAIGGKVLDNSANATLYVPKGSKEAYAAADYWKDFKEIKEFVNDESATYIVEDDKTVAVKDVLGSTGKDVEIPESVTINGEEYVVTAIAENAFENNETLEQVRIPATIEKIGDAAFAGCTSLKVIYSYAKEPIPLGSVKAKVRTRADGEEISASTVFAEVDKETCVLYVPSGSADKYRAADGWGEFKNIVEMDSEILGDANNDGKVDADDIEAITRYIMEGDDEGFIFKNADVNGDEKINAADIVEVVNIIKADK